MKRANKHNIQRSNKQVLENESKLAFLNFVPSRWIIRDIIPDFGLDIEITIVEGRKVTNKVLWLQLKATEIMKPNQKKITYQMKTQHLKYYESCNLPVVIIYWIKSENSFYYLFVQKYIKEILSKDNPNWRKQKTARLTFSSELETAEDLKSIATDGYFFVLQNKLNICPETAIYWLDGVPRSDNSELKERTLRAFHHMERKDYLAAIDEFENTLRVCVISPTEKMSTLLSLGNAYHSLDRYNDALSNYEAILDLAEKTNEKSALEGKSTAIGNIGLIYWAKGDLDTALKYYQESLEISRNIGYKQGEAQSLNGMGIIHWVKGDLDTALKYYQESLEISRNIGYKGGETYVLNNIGIIYEEKGDLDTALKYYLKSLEISRNIGYKQGEAHALNGIGSIYRNKSDLDTALKYYLKSLEISRNIGYKQGEAHALNGIGLAYSEKGSLDTALKCCQDALWIHRNIGYKLGEEADLRSIATIYRKKGDLDEELKYQKEAENLQVVTNSERRL